MSDSISATRGVEPIMGEQRGQCNYVCDRYPRCVRVRDSVFMRRNDTKNAYKVLIYQILRQFISEFPLEKWVVQMTSADTGHVNMILAPILSFSKHIPQPREGVYDVISILYGVVSFEM